MLSRDLKWYGCVAVNIDGARSMLSTRLGLQAHIKTINSSMIWHDCCIHRDVLIAKYIPEKLN